MSLFLIGASPTGSMMFSRVFIGFKDYNNILPVGSPSKDTKLSYLFQLELFP